MTILEILRLVSQTAGELFDIGPNEKLINEPVYLSQNPIQMEPQRNAVKDFSSSHLY